MKVFVLATGWGHQPSVDLAEVITHFGRKGLSVPAFTFREFSNCSLAKFLGLDFTLERSGLS
jgi:hypothetical protein